MFYKVLDGVKVLEYGNLISAPFCAKIMADLGADVIKIEKPGCGDDARRQEPFLNDIPDLDRSGLFQYLNMNKMSITLNPETATGKKLFDELIKGADIFIENNMPLRMKELEIDYEQVKQINPRIIMTSITAFGQTGPYKDYKGSELVNTHFGVVGYVSMREGDITQEPLKYPAHLFSFQAGLSAATATLGSLFHLTTTGSGEQIDVSETESAIQNINSVLARYCYTKQIVSRTDVLSVAPAHILPCKDGYIYHSFVQEHHWWRFVEVMDHPDWADNELFKTYATRALYWDALKPLLLEWTMKYTVEEIYRMCQAKSIPIGPVRNSEQVLSDEQMASRGFFTEIEHRENGKLKYPGVPYRFSEVNRSAPVAAPLLGQHNEDIYCGRLGYSKGDLVKLKEAGVI